MKKHLCSFLAVFLLCVFTNVSAQTIHYVKEGGTGDGTSWANASGDLQLMINSSVEGNQVWVAGGTYYPNRKADALNTISLNDRNNAFVLKKDVKTYGGFGGTETALTQRDSTRTTNITILSGDLGITGDSTDNAYHVVISADDVGTAELNGFKIEGGNANVYGILIVSSRSISKVDGGGIYVAFSSPLMTNLTVSGNNSNSGSGVYISNSFPTLNYLVINGNTAANNGGGIYNYNSSPFLNNVIISENKAAYGGGIYNTTSSSPVLNDVFITGNDAPRGGGFYNTSSSSPVLTNVTVSKNTGSLFGGGFYNVSNSSPVLTNVIVSGNHSNQGGGFYNQTSSSPVLTNVLISGNTSRWGGGIFNASSSPFLTNVTISENSATSDGGGIYNNSSSPFLTNVIVRGNNAIKGGGFYNTSSSPVLTNVIVSGNDATTSGGGFYNVSNSSPVLTNVTVSGNTTDPRYGGGIRNISSSPKIRNSIIYGNSTGISNVDASAPVITYSLVQELTTESNGNISGNKDPLFVNPISPGLSTDGDYRLKTSGSPAYNSGSNTFYSMGSVPDLSAITTDLDGNQRTTETINMGAYESSSALLTIYYVKEGGTGDGTSWASASGDLQLMINSTEAGDQVWVAGGTYYPIRRADALNTVSLNNRNNAFVLKKDVKIYGGFAGSETVLSTRDLSITANESILSGNLGDLTINTDNAYHVVISAGEVGTAELNGLSIKDGNATGTSTITVSTKLIVNTYGGGVYNHSSSPVLTNVTIGGNNSSSGGGGISNFSFSSPILINVTINGNDTRSSGGGIYNADSDPILNNVTISGNNATYSGGGIFNASSSPILNDVTIDGNIATGLGGGIYNSSSSPILTYVTISGNSANNGGGIYNDNSSSSSSPSTLTNVTISGNNAVINGGGIYNWGNSSVLTNVTVRGNNAIVNGGGIYNVASSQVLTNVTISGNNATKDGGGIFNNSSFPKIRNTIIYGNSSGIYNEASSGPVITYSLVQGLTDESNGNISGDKDPLFVNPLSPGLSTDGNYRLKNNTSPAYNTGSITFYSPDAIPDLSAITTDLDGNTRNTETISMGAYEYASALPVTIVNFTAKAEGSRAKLSWTTASESNNKEFIISRSADGITFSEIERVAGAGNTSTRRDYLYHDENPLNGNNFYQLEQLDFDGRRTVASIRNVQFASFSRINIYPNPVKHILQLEFKSGIYQKIELTDVNGRVLKVAKIGANDSRQEMNLSAFTSGTYFLRLTGDGKVETRRVVKE